MPSATLASDYLLKSARERTRLQITLEFLISIINMNLYRLLSTCSMGSTALQTNLVMVVTMKDNPGLPKGM